MDLNAAMRTETANMIDAIGVSATYTPVNGAQKTITVDFNEEYLGLELGMGEVASTDPAALCKAADVVGARQGDAITINGIDYLVVIPKPDGTGGVLFRLRKVV